jgi:hypothetical protein
VVVSQWLTLYTTPVIYTYLDRFARWVGESRKGLPVEPGMPPH